MNLVTVKGGKKGQRQLAEQIVYLMLDRLGLGRTRSLTIDLEIIRNLEKKEGVQGWHWEVEDKLDHEIGIDAGLGVRDFITSICHEMVHLKQVYMHLYQQELQHFGGHYTVELTKLLLKCLNPLRMMEET